MIDKEDLIEYGFKPYQAITIIRRTKYELVQEGYSFYQNKRLGKVPVDAVEKVIGTSLKIRP